jgi:uncharacterized protein (TIGR02266 family)
MSAVFEWDRFDHDHGTRGRSGRARMKIPVELVTGGDVCDGVTRDISQEGAFVATRRPPSVGDRVILRLAVPGHAVPLAVNAEVRWLRPIADAAGQPAGIGVAFVDPPYGVSLCIAWLLYCAG